VRIQKLTRGASQRNPGGAVELGWRRKNWMEQEELVGAGRTGWRRKNWVEQEEVVGAGLQACIHFDSNRRALALAGCGRSTRRRFNIFVNRGACAYFVIFPVGPCLQ